MITFKPVDQSRLIRRLEPPTGPVSMVLDTDTFNEVDDQFALAYSLLSQDRLMVEAVYAAPFCNERAATPFEGMEKSYAEILRLLEKMKLGAENFVFKGASDYLGETPAATPATRDLIARAHCHSEENPLYVVAIGAITNVATAILLDPTIIDSIHVVWLGGNPLGYPTTVEFNLMQDLPAVRTVLDCGVPLTIIPCMGVASHMLSTAPDVQAHLKGRNDLCDTLVELYTAYTKNHFGWAKEIWDIAPIAYLINPEWVPTKLEHSPLLTDDCHWARDERRHMIRMAYFAFRTPIFRDMFQKLGAPEVHA